MTKPQPPTFEDEGSLYSLAAEYLEAANILLHSAPVKLKVSLVTLYLLGHAGELLLKSFMCKRGVPIDDLKGKYGHNLAKLAAKARALGLSPSTALLNVEMLAESYASKHTEYRQNVATAFPSADLLLQELLALQNQVFDHVGQFE